MIPPIMVIKHLHTSDCVVALGAILNGVAKDFNFVRGSRIEVDENRSITISPYSLGLNNTFLCRNNFSSQNCRGVFNIITT